MIPQEIRRIYSLLCIFLGESKNELDESYQLQFACPRCVENKGENEHHKFNLEVNIVKGVFRCWSCSQDDDEMHGSIKKLIRLYGNETILKDYLDAVRSLRDSKYYQLFIDEDSSHSIIEEAEPIHLPTTFRRLKRGVKYNEMESNSLKYLAKRGITWDIIEKHKIGTCGFEKENKLASFRIILPSYDSFGQLNYWTGRDISQIKGRQKYFNTKAERKDLIFNEELIQWDADITLVEGPFDHIVVPNSIPLLGKSLNNEFKIYQDIFKKCNANVNVFLDGDAQEDVKKIYKLLDQGRMKGKIRHIPATGDDDPSSIFEKYGKRGIGWFLAQAKQYKEIELVC